MILKELIVGKDKIITCNKMEVVSVLMEAKSTLCVGNSLTDTGITFDLAQKTNFLRVGGESLVRGILELGCEKSSSRVHGWGQGRRSRALLKLKLESCLFLLIH